MGLLDDTKSEFAEVFLNSEDLGETITYTPFGGTPKAIQALVIDHSFNEETEEGHVDEVKAFNITISSDATDGIQTINLKDTLTIRGFTCEVDDVLETSFFSHNFTAVEKVRVERGFEGRRLGE